MPAHGAHADADKVQHQCGDEINVLRLRQRLSDLRRIRLIEQHRQQNDADDDPDPETFLP
jgi:hypothetical protein